VKQTFINLTHVITHLLFGAICLMITYAATNQRLDPLLFVPALIGSLLPDIDTSTSFIGRLVLPLSHFLERRYGHRQEIHTLWPIALILLTALVFPAQQRYIYALALGYAAHLLLDTLNPEGIAPLLPLTDFHLTMFGGKVQRQKPSEIVLLIILVVVTASTAFVTSFGPGELMAQLLPTTDVARETYRTWEGVYRVYADIEGTWNATHQRYSGRVEVAGLDPGGALLLRDPQTGATFTGGQHPVDKLYLSKITLIKGEPLSQPSAFIPQPSPTPIIITILVEGIHNPDYEILIRPGDVISKGQLIAELQSLTPTSMPAAQSTGQPQPDVVVLNAVIAEAELDLAQAEYKRALEGQSPSDATILQAESAIAGIEASIASLQYLQAANPNLSYVPAQITAAQARLTAAQARLEEVKKWKSPSVGDVAVAKAQLSLEQLRYQQAIATPTPVPTPTLIATPSPSRIVSLVSGHVLSIQIVRVVGNLATVEVRVTP
jgi:membrane-bound metal-dependent hydrolase YbcI (DUF457 family)